MTLKKNRPGACHHAGPDQQQQTREQPIAPTEGDQAAAAARHEAKLARQRSEVRAFLRLYMPDATTIALDEMADDAGFDPSILHDPSLLGKTLECTFKNYWAMGDKLLGRKAARLPQWIRPFDVDEEYVEAHIANRKRDRDIEDKQQKRDQAATAKRSIETEPGLDPRERAVCSVLSDRRATIREAAVRVRRHLAWRGPGGKLMDISTIKRRITEMLPRLSDYIERETDPDPQHRLQTTLIRLRAAPESAAVSARSLKRTKRI